MHTPEQMTVRSISHVFQKIAESCYKTWKGRIHCGNLWSPITLYPHLEPVTQIADFETCNSRSTGDISVIGFMDIAEVASPPILSRHLMFSAAMTKEQLATTPSVMNLDTMNSTAAGESAAAATADEDSGGGGAAGSSTESMDPGKQPSVCVLLHGALKIESMVAVCEVGPGWYGILYSWADSKKKFNLMLATFNVYSDCVPWLGPLRHWGLADVSKPLEQRRTDKKKSYQTQNTVVWIRGSGIESEVQKVLRLAKRLPEKTSNFFKELSRVRKAAASFAFFDLLSYLADLLEREVASAAGGPSSDAGLLLKYAVSVLRSSEAYVDIPPFKHK